MKGKYFSHQKSVAKVVCARFLVVIGQAGLILPQGIPTKLVVDCSHVGTEITDFKYLSRYLYHGVISERDIIANKGGHVTFKYVESASGKTKLRTLPGEEFLWLILQHVLP